MYLKIETEADIAEFDKYIDVSDLTVDFLLEPFTKKSHTWGSGTWARTEMVDTHESMLMSKALAGKKYGESEIRFYATKKGGYGYSSSMEVSEFRIFYNNASIDINVENCTIEYNHLRKNAQRPIEVMKEDGKSYVRLKWSEIYSEIIRINKRVNKTKHKVQVKELGTKWKMQHLLGKLEEAGVTIFSAAAYTDFLYSKTVFGRSFSVGLLKTDKATDIEIKDEDKLQCSLFGSDMELSFSTFLTYAKSLQIFVEAVNGKDKGLTLCEDADDVEEEDD
jgi:hypothetical protein